MRRCQKLLPCPTELVPASSNTDLPLAKAESMSNCGSASVKTYLKRGENCYSTEDGRED